MPGEAIVDRAFGGKEPQELLRQAMDDGITWDEWKSIIGSLGGQLLCVSRTAPDNEDKSLWKQLDRNSDDALSVEELSATQPTLAALDYDHNEIIEPEELSPYSNPLNRFFGQSSITGSPDEQFFAAFSPLEVSEGLGRKLFEQYQKDSRGGRTFDQVMQLLRDPPCDLALAVQLGPQTAPGKRIELLEIDGRPAPLAESVSKQADGSLVLSLAQVRLQLTAAPLATSKVNEAARKAEFKAADRDGNGYLDKQEIRSQASLRQSFDSIDRDSDDKIFEDEYLSWIQQRSELTESQVKLTTVDHGRLWFNVLDENHDGRLGRREMLQAAAKLPACDANGNGRLEKDEVPRVLAVTIGNGQPASSGRTPRGSPKDAGGRQGPNWFRKMDTNNDGDISPREFLGTKDQFKLLDANGDGLIDAPEAQNLTR
jgi:Ca2+-binding EF-hand superfamily protein